MSAGAVVLAVAILAVLSSSLAGLCVTHLRLSGRANNAMQATNLARSAIAAGIARVAETPEFGTSEGPPDSTIMIRTDAGEGFLTFSQTDAESQGVSRSTNNVGNTSAVEGASGPVGPDTVHLVARGVSQGVERRVEAVIKVPSYPWAVAATGKLEIVSGATVGALPSGVWPPTEDQLEPADLVSNSSAADSIVLDGTSRVLGDVETPGGVVIRGDGVTVEGQVREGAEATDIPVLDPLDYDPQRHGLSFDDLSGGTMISQAADPTSTGGPGMVLTGAARREGDLVLNQGLKLDAASLFVNGNLTVTGPVEGYGLLVVTGSVTLDTGMVLQGATQLAVLSGDRVTMRGYGPESTAIRGIFYARNGVVARRMTVIGALIAGGEDADILMDDVSVFSQEAVKMRGAPAASSGSGSVISAWEDIWLTVSTRLDPTDVDGGDQPTLADPPGDGAGTSTTALGGPSSFISLRDRMKIVSWVEN